MGIVIGALMGLTGCGDGRLAGTSSGVDNPQLTLAFRDSTGSALRVSGDLNLYAQNQNPAVDPQPLWTIKLKNSAFTNLTAQDISRINDTAAAKIAASKPGVGGAAKIGAASAASAKSASQVDTALSFNLELKTDSRVGFLIFGLNYNPATKKFTWTGDTAVTRLSFQPKPLISYQAHISGDAVTSNLSRVFIPGTAFQATLVDSAFTFDDLPQGVFPLRVLTSDGRVFAVKESLDTHTSPVFTTGTDPIGKVDTIPKVNGDSSFQIKLPANHEAFLNAPSILEGTLTISSTTPGLSFLWKQMHGPSDTALPLAHISSPTSLRTEVNFPEPGAYVFQLTVTLGVRTLSDTVVISVREAPPPLHPEIIQPKPDEDVPVGQPYNVMWGLPAKGPVTVRFSANNGEKWTALIEHFASLDSLPIYTWTPDSNLVNSIDCLIEVRLEADTTIAARMPGPFHLIAK